MMQPCLAQNSWSPRSTSWNVGFSLLTVDLAIGRITGKPGFYQPAAAHRGLRRPLYGAAVVVVGGAVVVVVGGAVVVVVVIGSRAIVSSTTLPILTVSPAAGFW
jgi:hypothetical protein